MGSRLLPKEVFQLYTIFFGFLKNLGFEPKNYQREFLESCLTQKRIIGIWSRQSGKSTCIASYCSWRSLFIPNSKILIISPTQSQSDLDLLKIKTFLHKKQEIEKEILRETAESILFKNGSEIRSLPVGNEGKTIRGYTANVIILEEAALIKDSIVQEVITPMGAAQKDLQIIKIGTPFGRNHFYKSTMQDKNYTVHKYDYTYPLREGLYTLEFIEEQKSLMGENSIEFRTEYGAEFLDETNSYFGSNLTKNCVDPEIKKILVDYSRMTLLGDYHPKNEYVISADLARLGEDKTVIMVIEYSWQDNIGRVVYIEETYHNLMNEVEAKLKLLNKLFTPRKIILDTTGIGAGTGDHLKAGIGNKVECVEFTNQIKQDLFSNLRMLLEKRGILYPAHKKLLYELSIFSFKISDSMNVKLSAPEGEHDDYVFALCLGASYKKVKMNYVPSIF